MAVNETIEIEHHEGHHEHRPKNGAQALIAAMRPKQWSKNVLLFASLLFTLDVHHSAYDFLRVTAGFIVFCLLSSAGYLVNDTLDAETDRKHPRKRYRPVAAGELTPNVAISAAVVMAVASLAAAVALGWRFAVVSVFYLILTTLYTLKLKHVVILDILVLAVGFVVRAVAGAWVIPVGITPWLVLCTLFLALFLGLSKRRGELIAVSAGRRGGRAILSEYTAEMLDQMTTIVTSALLMSYALYTIDSESAKSRHYLMATIPFVVYGMFRYLYLIHRHGLGETPDEILIKDKPTLVNIVLWATTAALIVLHPWAR